MSDRMVAGREIDRRFAGRLSFLLKERGVIRTPEEILGWEWEVATWHLLIRMENEIALATVGALPTPQGDG